CVALRRREARVAEQLLDAAQVRAAAEEVRREGVAERVRRRVAGHARGGEPALQRALHGAHPEAFAGAREEERARVAVALAAEGEAALRIGRQRGVRLLAEGHDALLV